jgi:hypothetical protein
MHVSEIFPTTRARLRLVMYGAPKSVVWATESNDFIDPFPADPVLYGRLLHLDAIGRALLLELVDYRYKPGWTFELVQCGRGMSQFSMRIDVPYYVRIGARLPDSTWTAPPGKTEQDRPVIMVCSEQPVWDPLWLANDRDQQRNAETFVAMLRGMIRAVEEHEIDEWFRRGDQLVHDPHAQKAPSEIGPIHRG